MLDKLKTRLMKLKENIIFGFEYIFEGFGLIFEGIASVCIGLFTWAYIAFFFIGLPYIAYSIGDGVYSQITYYQDLEIRQAITWEDHGLTVCGLGFEANSSITNNTVDILTVEVRHKFDGIVNNDADLMYRYDIQPGDSVDVEYLHQEYYIIVIDDGEEVGRIDLAQGHSVTS
jgi:hypothetical protein